MKNKSVQNCRFVHHAQLHCIVTTLNRLFKIEFERRDWKRTVFSTWQTSLHYDNVKLSFSKIIFRGGTKVKKFQIVISKILNVPQASVKLVVSSVEVNQTRQTNQSINLAQPSVSTSFANIPNLTLIIRNCFIRSNSRI